MLPDFRSLTPAAVAADVDETLAAADRLLAGATTDDTARTWETTMAPLDGIAGLLAECFGRTAFMGYVHPDPAVRTAGREAEERISKWSVALAFRPDVYAAVTAFAATSEAAALTGERARLLAFTLRDLRKAGHELPAEDRDRLEGWTRRLVELGIAFERGIAECGDRLVVRPEDLVGMPPEYVSSLEPGPGDGTLAITMAYPHVVPFLESSPRRDLREALSRLFNSRAAAENRPLLEEAVRIRRHIAALFGEASWAEHVLDDKMARTPAAVAAFYDGLVGPLTSLAREEVARMTALLTADTGDTTLQPYDWRYYETRIRTTELGMDPFAVAAYFPLDAVLRGLLDITGEVFGLDYRPSDLPTWHPDVVAYAVHDRASGDHVADVLMDLFPREGKFSHAAAFPLVPGRRRPDGTTVRPVSAIVANVPKPRPEQPSLLPHDDVEMIFHEFGHVLHQTLARTELVRFAGTATEHDFVEAPSQIMEHWVWRPDVLARFARHHVTGEPVPAAVVERLTALKRLNVGLFTLRQISLGLLDLRLHGDEPVADLEQLLRETTAVGLLPFHEGTFFPASFGHLFGYDAGYYGYLWSEVYGDDMWSRFEAEGVTSPAVGADYRRTILEPGGSRDALDLLREFLGREPDQRAFLAELGLTS